MYHRIAHESFDPWGLAVEPDCFEAQLHWLVRHRTVLPLSDFARRHRLGQLPRHAVAITFDDGYASVLHTAVPLLERMSLMAAVFLPTELIERRERFWWDELARIIVTFRGNALRFANSFVAVPPAHERDGQWAPDAPATTARQELFYSLWSELRKMRSAGVDAIMAELRMQFRDPVTTIAADRPIDPHDLGTVNRAAIEFGSHALSHSSLPSLNDAAKRREIEDSRKRCAAMTGNIPVSFAYPYGDFDDSILRITQESGFECAVTVEPDFVRPQSNSFSLPRFTVGNWDAGVLGDRLGGW